MQKRTPTPEPAVSERPDLPLPHNTAVAQVWDTGGAAYDEISRGILDSIEHCVNRLRPDKQEHILDVATGTGWTARRVAERGARVTGVDISCEELDAARRLSRRMGLGIDYRRADAEALPFEDAAFDGVISTCGVMFASRPEDAAAELGRICRPGGRVALTTWTPDGNVFGMFKIIKSYMPTPSDPAKAPPSPFDWGRRKRVEDLLERDFELRIRGGGFLLSGTGRRDGVADLLERLWARDESAGEARRRAARGLPTGFR